MFQDRSQQLKFQEIRNDQSKKSSQRLIAFKTIIAKALPNMDKPHIVRLLFDKRHHSLVALEANVLIGGVTYACFENEDFVQIAFLAVRAEKRIQGYGKKIINKLKSHLQKHKMKYMITYGDNMALGFFRKQGFSQKITMPRQKWEGYIKQYDGGKLMQCKIHPTVDYINIESIIKKQKQFLINTIKLNSTNQTKFPGDKVPIKNSTQFFERKTVGGQIEKFKRDPRTIPGIIQSGWTWQEHDQISKFQIQPLNIRCKKLLQSIKKHPQSKYFLQPVSAKQVPTYQLVIKNPIDLSVINQKIKNQQYVDEQSFCEDIELIFQNCKAFNHFNSVYYKSAIKLRQLISPQIQAFRHAVINTTKQSKQQRKQIKKN